MSRQYFYEENGKLKRYSYCSLCGKGPFKESQVVNDDPTPEKIACVAGQTTNTKIYYCYVCNNHICISKSILNNEVVNKVQLQVEDDEQDEQDEVIEEAIEQEIDLPEEELVVEKNQDAEPIIGHLKNHSDELLRESKKLIYTPLLGNWSVILLKGKNGQLFCKSVEGDANQFTIDLNSGKLQISTLKNLPFELVYYRRVLGEVDAKIFEDIIKKRPKLFKDNLIENFKRTLGGKNES